MQRHTYVFTILPKSCNEGVARAFQERSEVVWFESEHDQRRPRKKMLMHLGVAESQGFMVDIRLLGAVLKL